MNEETKSKVHIVVKVLKNLLLIILVFLSFRYAEEHLFKKTEPEKIAPTNPVVVVNSDGSKATKSDPQVVYVQGQSTNTREVVYTPKEIDKTTGQKELTDVQFENKDGKVYVKVNGKLTEVPTHTERGSEFKDGKIVITDQTSMTLDLRTPQDNPVKGLGLGVSNWKNPAIYAGGKLGEKISWHVIGSKDAQMGGLTGPIKGNLQWWTEYVKVPDQKGVPFVGLKAQF